MERKIKLKMIAMASIMLASLLLLVSVSFAWFSISTSPEVSGLQVTLFSDRAVLVSADGETFDQSVSLAETFKYYADLKPISTVDGVNWFRAEYANTGSVKSFILDNTGKHGNVGIYMKDASGNFTDTLLGPSELFDAEQEGYYVYCDIWLATELEEGCRVTLSAPDLAVGNLQEWETDEEHEHGAKYGSYALAAYKKADDSETVYNIDNNAQTALRVGFMTYKVDGSTDRFVIYEPNADQRSLPDLKPSGGDEVYIKDFVLLPNENFNPDDPNSTEPQYLNYRDGTYIPTYPIGIVKDQNGNDTYVPTAIAPENLIIQKRSAWDESEIEAQILAGKSLNSNNIASFGSFVRSTSTLTNSLNNLPPETKFHTFLPEPGDPNTGLASESIIVTLPGRKDGETLSAQKVTMFIWLEGQDVDCWNDIADGTFVINLEFAAQ